MGPFLHDLVTVIAALAWSPVGIFALVVVAVTAIFA